MTQRSDGLGDVTHDMRLDLLDDLTYGRNDNVNTGWCPHKVLCGMRVDDKGAAVLG